jgi:hypothetical protein
MAWDIPAGRSAIADGLSGALKPNFTEEDRTGDQYDAFKHRNLAVARGTRRECRRLPRGRPDPA